MPQPDTALDLDDLFNAADASWFYVYTGDETTHDWRCASVET